MMDNGNACNGKNACSGSNICGGQNAWNGPNRGMGMNRGCGCNMGRQTAMPNCNMENRNRMWGGMPQRGFGCMPVNMEMDRKDCDCERKMDRKACDCEKKMERESCGCEREMDRKPCGCEREMDRKPCGCEREMDRKPCGCEKKMDRKACGCESEKQPVDRMQIGMGYVPCQKFENLLEAEEGFQCGTIFRDLVLPFLGRPLGERGMCR